MFGISDNVRVLERGKAGWYAGTEVVG
jgi:hypothetical protein